jgi:N-acetyltransferase 10
MNSLKQLYTMAMDVHSRYRTEAHDDVVNRFNERFILSLGNCANCLVLDDELNILPISAGRSLKALPDDGKKMVSANEEELVELKKSLEDTQPVGALVGATKTLDQAKAVLTFVEAISEKSLRSTVTLTAARGRGKSAALGISIAAAVAYGYSNIFITSPTPENLKTLFEFIFKGFDALEYTEHMDYDIIQSTNPNFNKAIVRVNIFRQHRQTIQYIQPQDYQTLAQAELVVIDEAAAIPLPLVKKLMGPYLVFMASTINGYEGTGRSLSLKLIQQLREESRGFHGKTPNTQTTSEGTVTTREGKAVKGESEGGSSSGARSLREIKLEEPIRYGLDDPIEKWLNKLLCLDSTVVSKNIQGCPHPDQCELYSVNRDTLFSYHPVSETFLQRMMGLYVASHYKNTPNDLQLMSDAPAHQLFVLLPPVDPQANTLPDPLCVVQICLEGQISKKSIAHSLSRGIRSGGDLIPWLVSQQFQDDDFATLSGARVVRIATHPDYSGMGYGSRALQLLEEFYSGKFVNLDETSNAVATEAVRVTDSELENGDLSKDLIKIRDPSSMPPLLMKLNEQAPVNLDYLGVSYGLTPQLHKFWKRSGFAPLYIRQTTNELTGEHTCVMVKPLATGDDTPKWVDAFTSDFSKRFLSLLSFQFRSFPSVLALSILESTKTPTTEIKALGRQEMEIQLTPYDLKRLESYANNLLDYHVIMDLIPQISTWAFQNKLDIKLSGIQNSILLSLGMQRKSFEDVEAELNLPVSQLLALFAKSLKKIAQHFGELKKEGIIESNPSLAPGKPKHFNGTDAARDATDDSQWKPIEEDLHTELDAEGRKQLDAIKDRQKELIDAIDLTKFIIPGSDKTWEASNIQVDEDNKVSVKNSKRTIGQTGQAQKLAESLQKQDDAGKKRKKNKNKK